MRSPKKGKHMVFAHAVKLYIADDHHIIIVSGKGRVIDKLQRVDPVALKQQGINPEDVGLVVHGTTVATNAMLERKGARAVLLTTGGLEDVLEIGRQNRDDIYNINANRAEPLVARDDRIGIAERLDSEGNIVTELTKETIEQAISQVTIKQPESVAISLPCNNQ